MAISGVNGSQGPQEPNNNLPVKKNDKQDNTAEIDKKIREYFNSAASMENDKNKIDSEKESTFFNNAIKTLKNQFPGAANIIDNIVDKLTGGNNAKETAVNEATYAPVNEEPTEFDKDGNSITGVSNGGNTMTLGDESVTYNPEDKSLTVEKNGKIDGGTKVLPNGMQTLTQSDGKVYVYNPETGEYLPDDEAQKILAQFQ